MEPSVFDVCFFNLYPSLFFFPFSDYFSLWKLPGDKKSLLSGMNYLCFLFLDDFYWYLLLTNLVAIFQMVVSVLGC